MGFDDEAILEAFVDCPGYLSLHAIRRFRPGARFRPSKALSCERDELAK